MRAKKIVPLAILALLVLLSTTYPVHALAIGASPATLTFQLAPGSQQTKTFQISTNSEAAIPFSLDVSDTIGKFVTLSKENGQASLTQPAEISVTVKVPLLTKKDTYEGTLLVTTSGSDSIEEGMGSVIATGVAVKVIIDVTNEVQTSSEDVNKNLAEETSSESEPASNTPLVFWIFAILVIVLIGAIIWLTLRK